MPCLQQPPGHTSPYLSAPGQLPMGDGQQAHPHLACKPTSPTHLWLLAPALPCRKQCPLSCTTSCSLISTHPEQGVGCYGPSPMFLSLGCFCSETTPIVGCPVPICIFLIYLSGASVQLVCSDIFLWALFWRQAVLLSSSVHHVHHPLSAFWG